MHTSVKYCHVLFSVAYKKRNNCELEGTRESAYLRQVDRQLSLETCLSSLKSIALTVLELLAFNAPVSKMF